MYVCVGFGFSLNKLENGVVNRCRKRNVLMSEKDMNKRTSWRNCDKVRRCRRSYATPQCSSTHDALPSVVLGAKHEGKPQAF